MANITGTSRFLRILAERGTTGLVELTDEDLSFNGSHTIQSIGGTLTLTGTLTINAFTLGGAITGGGQQVNSLGNLGIGVTPSYELHISKATSGDSVQARIINTSNTANSVASIELSVAGASAGDTYLNFNISGLKNWTIGIDNSDEDSFKIDGSGALGATPSVRIVSTEFQLASDMILSGVGTGANGIKLKNLKNSTASALSGTQLDIEIDIGGTPYYFTVYPTKA